MAFFSEPEGGFWKPNTESTVLLGAVIGISYREVLRKAIGFIFKNKIKYGHLNFVDFSSIKTTLAPYSNLKGLK